MIKNYYAIDSRYDIQAIINTYNNILYEQFILISIKFSISLLYATIP